MWTDFDKAEQIIKVRDNGSDVGTYKKENSGRMNLNPKTLYEFDFKQNSGMVF